MVAKLENVPEEIFLVILREIHHDPIYLIPYVTVSRRWQCVIEASHFKSFQLEKGDLSTFAKLFRPDQVHRKALVKDVQLNVELPEYEGENYHQHEEANNRVFSDAIFELFHILDTFDNDDGVKNGDGIFLNVRKVSAPKDSFRLATAVKIWRKPIQLLEPEKVPTLSCVSRFHSGRMGPSRKPDPASMVLLASKLKGLKICSLDFCNGRHIIDAEAHSRMRGAFAKALYSYANSLDEFQLEFRGTSPLDEASMPPNLQPFSSPVDPFNLSIHELIQRAAVKSVSFSAQHVISPEFFWPLDRGIPTTASPFWPNLKEIILRLSPATPDGDWYFMADPKIASHSEFVGSDVDKSNTEEVTKNGFRTMPNPAKMNPLLIAMAHAVRYAPCLQEIQLFWGRTKLSPKYLKRDVEMVRQFEAHYLARGLDDPYGDSPTDKPRLLWEVQDWRPDDEVKRQWNDALGPEGTMIFR